METKLTISVGEKKYASQYERRKRKNRYRNGNTTLPSVRSRVSSKRKIKSKVPQRLLREEIPRHIHQDAAADIQEPRQEESSAVAKPDARERRESKKREPLNDELRKAKEREKWKKFREAWNQRCASDPVYAEEQRRKSRERSKRKYERNREASNARRREWGRLNRERKNETQRKWYEANKEHARELIYRCKDRRKPTRIISRAIDEFRNCTISLDELNRRIGESLIRIDETVKAKKERQQHRGSGHGDSSCSLQLREEYQGANESETQRDEVPELIKKG
ncbi:MAG: hypothetical protein ACXVCY_04465 [Pseudobdellovibrionaceae bacterium]